MRKDYKRIGDFIKRVNEKNELGNVDLLLGVNLDKEFFPSVANTVGTDMTRYNIIKKGQFGCKLMSVGRDKKLPISRLTTHQEALISSAYFVFEVKDEEELHPDYLMMWFSRSESDRYLWFLSGGDIRGRITWDEFTSLPIKVPTIEKQREIVAEYQAVENKIKTNEQICEKLEAAAQALYKHWFVDFEFPNEEDLPYKSSGGVMVYNEELEKEIPKGWEVGTLSKICKYSNKRISVNKIDTDNYVSTENLLPNKLGVTSASSLPSVINVTRYEIGNVLISNIRPYFKKIWLANSSGGCSNDVLCFVAKSEIPPVYLYQTLERDIFFEYVMAGSKGTKMPRGDKNWIMNYPIIIPSTKELNNFSQVIRTTQDDIELRKKQNQKLTQFQSLLLARMVKDEGSLNRN